MAKKLGKLLLFSVAVGAVAGAVYYLQKKDNEALLNEDTDLDDFSGESSEPRKYVTINTESAKEKIKDVSDKVKDTVSTYAAKAANATDKLMETLSAEADERAKELKSDVEDITDEIDNTSKVTVEEFFDEDKDQDKNQDNNQSKS